MSATRRVLSGNLAAWCGIAIGFMTQLLLVPIYLSRWDKASYGLWLALQSLINVLELLDYGHQGYLQNEFLRIGDQHRRFLKRTFWSSTLIGFFLGLTQLLFVALLTLSGLISHVMGVAPAHVADFSFLLVLNIANWWITGSVLGLAERLLASLGYYSKFAWWSVASIFVSSISPALAVLLGASFRLAGIIQVVGILGLNVPLSFYVWALLRKEGMGPVRPDLKLGLRNLWRSQVVTVTSLVDRLKQDGVRILLAPLAGSGATATFSTMRTGANVIQQGVGTVTGPIMPELMRYLNLRDQEKCETAFATIWVIILAVMAPGAIVMQWAAPTIFAWWTHGKIQFDPVLFALLTFTVLLFSTQQPAMAIVQGNNILSTRLTISILSGGCAIGGIFLLVPHWSLRGVGVALLLSEVVSAAGYCWQASRWMNGHQMKWPWLSFAWVIMSVLMVGVAMGAMIGLPHISLLLVALSLCVQSILSAGYWKLLPASAKDRTAALVERRVPVLGKRLAVLLK